MKAINCIPSAVEVGNNIRKLRVMKNYKQSDLAMKIDMCPEALSKIENGKTDISLSRLCSIADALNVDIKILFSDPAHLVK